MNDASERPLLTPRGALETGRLENTLPAQPAEVADIIRHYMTLLFQEGCFQSRFM